LERSTFRVLVVDDYEPWRSFASTKLQTKPGLQVVSEASDGLEAVQKAQGLQPDLILLDIGLPTINGIEAARRILQHSPNTKILFVSEQRSPDIVEEALRTGAGGYVVKSKAATELLLAVEAVLQGKKFVSVSLTAAFSDPKKERTARRRRHEVTLTPRPNVETVHHHEVGFYSDDRSLLDDLTQFIGAALKAGNAAIVAATESHRNNLLARLQAQGVDIGGAIEQGRYIAFDTADALSTFMVDDTLDPVRFIETFGNLIATAAKAVTTEHPRVAVFGECVHFLWAQGNSEAAIQMEKLGNLLTRTYEVDILCGYSVGSVHSEMDPHLFQQICAQHSAAYSR
jgi:DNA-binding NarL/FixJ family response regulator